MQLNGGLIMALDDSAFEKVAMETLEDLMDAIDEGLGDCLDVDLNGGILTIELDDGGQYILNKHGASHQIWMSSPVSGATHFDYDGAAGEWVSTKGEGELKFILGSELEKTTGETVSL